MSGRRPGCRELRHPEGVDHRGADPGRTAGRRRARLTCVRRRRAALARDGRPVPEPHRAQGQVDGGAPWGCAARSRSGYAGPGSRIPPPLVREDVHLEHVARRFGRQVPDRRDRGTATPARISVGGSSPDLSGCCRGPGRGCEGSGPPCRAVPEDDQERQALDDNEDRDRTPEHGDEQVERLCAYGPLGSNADWVAFGAQAAHEGRATRPMTTTVLLRTFRYPPHGPQTGTEAAHCSTVPGPADARFHARE